MQTVCTILLSNLFKVKFEKELKGTEILNCSLILQGYSGSSQIHAAEAQIPWPLFAKMSQVSKSVDPKFPTMHLRPYKATLSDSTALGL